MALLSRFEGPVYALMRIVIGFLFLQHGSQKLLGVPVAMPEGVEVAGLVLAAGIIELVGGALVMLGLFAGWAAFLCSGTMAVAFFLFHAAAKGTFLPIMNGGEPAAVYCWIFLYIAARGSGPWSVDALRGALKS